MFEESARPAQDINFDDLESSLFDNELESPGEQRRRRRPVADWGGDDLFNHVPRRRFARPPAAAHVRRPGGAALTSHQMRRGAEPLPPRSGEHRDADPGAGILATFHSAVQRPIITIYEPHDEATVAEGGATARRRRPARTVGERLGPRPDRIAAWAFALGLLLILLAVSTADAAALAGF